MSVEHENKMDAALERLKKMKKKIDQKCDESSMSEPKSLVSGEFNELDLKRRIQGHDNEE